MIAVVASAGGLPPLQGVLEGLPRVLPAAVVVLQHRTTESRLPQVLARRSPLPVLEAADGTPLRPGVVLVAPAGVHTTVVASLCVRLVRCGPVNFLQSSADLLLASLADACGGRTVAVVLSGCGDDGTRGARAVRAAGGVVIAQHESGCDHPEMPVSVRDVGLADLVLRVGQIPSAICSLSGCWKGMGSD